MPFFNIEIKTKQNKILLNQKNRRPYLNSNQFILDNPNKNKQTFRMTKLYLFLVVLFSAVSLVAGPTEGLIAYYPFNGNTENQVESDQNQIKSQGNQIQSAENQIKRQMKTKQNRMKTT